MKRLNIRGALLNLVGLVLSVVPPLVATLSYFPLFVEKGADSVLSGIALILLIISAVPLFKFLRRALDSPSARTVWLIAFALFFTLGKIADEITVISFVGALSNLIAGVFFALAKRRGADEKRS